MSVSILQQDIELVQVNLRVYANEVEECARKVRFAITLDDELYWNVRKELATRILTGYQNTYRALVAYKQLCDLRS